MNASVNIERNSWRLPPDETVQVADPRSKSAQDLTYSDGGHNWRSIIFSLLVIGGVIAGIVTAIYLLGYVDELLYWSGRRLTLEECLHGDLTPHRLPPTWISHDKFVYQADDGSLALLDTSNNSISLLVSNHTLVFRHTFTAHYTVYDVTNDHHTPLRLQASPRIQQTRLQHAAWLGNTTALLMVSDNDIYVRGSPNSAEDTRLTDTGLPGIVYNGVPDWLYQEEVMPRPDCTWPSPDGSHLLYASFNDSKVNALEFPWFGASVNSETVRKGVFPPSRTVRYPTPGSPNPEVDVWIVDFTNVTTGYNNATNLTSSTPSKVKLKPPPVFDGQEYYLISAGWIGEDSAQVAVVWMTRSQNLSWLDAQPHPVFAPDGDSFLLLGAVQEGAQEHFTHIKHITLTQQRIAVLSHGRYEVSEILAWDTRSHLVYYLATRERSPGQKHLYVVKDPIADDPRRLEPLCVTCDIADTQLNNRFYYTNCTHFGASVNPPLLDEQAQEPKDDEELGYYVLYCEGPGLPLAAIHSMRTHKIVRVLYDTRIQRAELLSQLALPKRQSFEDQVTVLRHLLDTLKYLDESRVGVWGWGYGGYVTSMVLGSQQNVFKCGVAVNPIADWLYYNSAFTERVLGPPAENYKGYVEADLTQRARLVPSHSLYLLHGMADLSSPYTHGMAFAKSLTESGVIFRYQSYADEDHALSGVLEHAYHSMEDFLAECLALDAS
ncbi:hypothetical protein TSAR_008581 [Trichomalopsis sarcophagae]|uniref:Peptidase S9 prolyl oligopeptidase catalytic domain-containing protein n=1 Tax=Trichomalopsis sarcophagae TaxID=543379 RepID=A0A232EY97_9HYME|nr:hypothetical protein TSAR_008581 [Trichomalopsis sarcophagae]